MRREISSTLGVFLGLALVYTVLIATAKNAGDPFAQSVLVGIASAIFAAGLAVFLIHVLSQTQHGIR